HTPHWPLSQWHSLPNWIAFLAFLGRRLVAQLGVDSGEWSRYYPVDSIHYYRGSSSICRLCLPSHFVSTVSVCARHVNGRSNDRSLVAARLCMIQTRTRRNLAPLIDI